MKADLVRIVQRLETEASDGRTMMVPPPPPRGMQVVPTTPPPSTGGAADRVSRHFAAIDAALAAGDDARARQELQLATQAAPGHPRLGEMGAKISQARTERELARSIGEARARLAAGALTEAGQWLVRAQKVAPHAPEVAELRQEIERAADGREQEQDRQRRVAAALAHAREALKGGAFDTAMRAVTEALGLDPHDAEAQAVKAEIEAASGAPAPRPGTGSRAVGPPPPASARQLTDAAHAARPPTGSRPAATAPPLPPGPPPELPLQPPALGSPSTPPPAFGAEVPVQTLVQAAARLPRHRRGGRDRSSASPRSSSGARSRPGSSPDRSRRRKRRPRRGRRAPPSRRPRRRSRRRARPPRRRPTPTRSRAAPPEPPVAPPTTPSSEDAAITSRLAQAVAEFQAQRTSTALNTLASLIDEAPQRDDLRQTAEQWARAIQARMGELARERAQAGPAAAGDADGRRLRPARRGRARARAIRSPPPGPSSAAARRGPPSSRARCRAGSPRRRRRRIRSLPRRSRRAPPRASRRPASPRARAGTVDA